jgi:hypothetical protein
MMRPVIFSLAILAISTAACGQQPADLAYAREVAVSVDKACYPARSQAPNAAFARHLDRLCKCTHDRIAATPMSRSDGQQAQYEKVQAAMGACEKELGGVADAEDYKATGIKPPDNSARH